ncbi:MAG: VWA domain-containing protein [Gemmatimonadetes bacterium]|nr:VWA domain-containing protein [Gemmatimonadota bacterium]MYG83771.1 VWA domain-containing protein [Gemmatimonadota bacterium]MYJ90431.1 VWA domain-containing protein [Gemmatimonadota bacterium]
MDLAFLNLTFLFGALGAAVPLILHLVRRQRAGIHVFSMVRFLISSQRSIVRQQRFRRLLLLLLRMAACALLAVIFARPFLRDQDETVFAGTQPEAVAILVDTSYSMGYGNRIALAKRRAAEILNDLQTGDQVALLTFAVQARVIRELGSSHSELPVLVDSEVSATFQATDYVEALRAADDQLSGSDFDRRTVYLVSDFQQSGWNPRSGGWKLGPGVQLRMIDVGDAQDDNSAVTGVEIPTVAGMESSAAASVESSGSPASEGRALSADGRTLDVAVRIRNFGQAPFRDEVTLRVNGIETGKRRIDIPPHSGRVEIFRQTFGSATNTGEVILGEDGLPVDNRFYFTVNAPTPVRVLCLEERSRPDRPSEAAYYLSQALSLRRDPPVVVDVLSPDALTAIDTSEYDVVISANLSVLPRASKDRLTGYVLSGGSLIIALNPAVSSGIFNSSFGELLPGRIASLSSPDSPRDRDRYRLLTDVNYQHPVFQPFSGPRHGDFGTVRFFRTARFDPDSSASVPARFDDGAAAVAEKPLGNGRTFLVLSTFDLAWTDFPIREVFVPFLYESIDYLASRGTLHERGAGLYRLAGEAVRLPDGAQHVELPSGEQVPVETSRSGRKLFTQTRQPGLYRVQSAGGRQTFAVNLDTRESDFTRLDPQAFAAALINPVAVSPEVRETESQDRLARDAEVERRQGIWWILGFTLIALVLGETLLANRTHR